jgi:hypothetical protein
MKKWILPEISEILLTYFNSQSNFELSNILDNKIYHNEKKMFDGNFLFICDQEDLEIISDLEICKNSKKIFFLNHDLYDPHDLQNFFKKNNLNDDVKFDQIIVFFSTEKIRNFYLLKFLLSQNGKCIFVECNKNIFQDIKKNIMESDLKHHGYAIQRFRNIKNFVELETHSLFKHVVITSNEFDIQIPSINWLLNDKNNSWIFVSDHNIYKLFCGENEIEIKFLINVVIIKNI